MSDRITLTGLEIHAHHGVFDFERTEGQLFIVDLDVVVNIHDAAQSDDLSRTVHYGELAERVVHAVQTDPVELIETVAERIARVALEFSAVEEVTVTVHKPYAPIPVPFNDVSVTITRRRS